MIFNCLLLELVISQRSTLHFSGSRRARSFKKLGFSMILNLIRGDARRCFAFLPPNSNAALTWISSPEIDLYGSCFCCLSMFRSLRSFCTLWFKEKHLQRSALLYHRHFPCTYTGMYSHAWYMHSSICVDKLYKHIRSFTHPGFFVCNIGAKLNIFCCSPVPLIVYLNR